jgi:hypothetical protein
MTLYEIPVGPEEDGRRAPIALIVDGDVDHVLAVYANLRQASGTGRGAFVVMNDDGVPIYACSE